MLYLALFPTTLFLIAVYSESLYLLLSIAAFLFGCADSGLAPGSRSGSPR